MLGDAGAAHDAAGARRFREHEAAIVGALDDRVADVRPVGNRLPVGVQPAGGLAAAFDDVPGEAALREAIPVVLRPLEFMNTLSRD